MWRLSKKFRHKQLYYSEMHEFEFICNSMPMFLTCEHSHFAGIGADFWMFSPFFDYLLAPYPPSIVYIRQRSSCHLSKVQGARAPD